VLDRAAVGVELLADLEGDGVQAPLRVGELHPLAGTERPRTGRAHAGPCNAATRSAAARMPAGRPSGSTTRYSRAGVARTAASRSLPDMPVRSTSPGSSGRATSVIAIHGRR